MSEVTHVGVLDGITEKPSGWTEISIKVEGWQHPVRTATKLQPLVELARAAGSERMEWTWKEQESENINPNSGKPYVNRYFEGVQPINENGQNASGSPSAAPSSGLSKEEWAAKDSAIHLTACIKAAADALKHTVPSEPTVEDLSLFTKRTLDIANSWHNVVIATREHPEKDDFPF